MGRGSASTTGSSPTRFRVQYGWLVFLTMAVLPAPLSVTAFTQCSTSHGNWIQIQRLQKVTGKQMTRRQKQGGRSAQCRCTVRAHRTDVVCVHHNNATKGVRLTAPSSRLREQPHRPHQGNTSLPPPPTCSSRTRDRARSGTVWSPPRRSCWAPCAGPPPGTAAHPRPPMCTNTSTHIHWKGVTDKGHPVWMMEPLHGWVGKHCTTSGGRERSRKEGEGDDEGADLTLQCTKSGVGPSYSPNSYMKLSIWAVTETTT